MNRRSGLTLVEMLIVIAMTAIILVALGSSYAIAVRFQREMPAREDARLAEISFERQLRATLQGAFLTADEDDTTSYFIASNQGQASGEPDTITFTTTAYAPSGDFIATEDEFENLNETFGPQGGLTEVSLSMSPVGDSGDTNQAGLFLRKQRPSDGDATQGGNEELLNGQIETLSFQLFDGVDWVSEWDTTTGERRLPAAVRVYYTLVGDDQERVLTVRLPQSDVTLDNPAQQGVTPAEGAAATAQ